MQFHEVRLREKRTLHVHGSQIVLIQGILKERTILLIRRPQTYAREIWLLPAEGRRYEVKACTFMKADDNNRSQFALRGLVEKHSMHIRRSDDDRPKGNRREQDTCLLAFTYLFTVGCTREPLV